MHGALGRLIGLGNAAHEPLGIDHTVEQGGVQRLARSNRRPLGEVLAHPPDGDVEEAPGVAGGDMVGRDGQHGVQPSLSGRPVAEIWRQDRERRQCVRLARVDGGGAPGRLLHLRSQRGDAVRGGLLGKRATDERQLAPGGSAGGIQPHRLFQRSRCADVAV